MSNLIIARRKFLFLAPAIVASTGIMKVHSIERLFFNEYDEIMRMAGNGDDVYRKVDPITRVLRYISKAEYEWNKTRILAKPHIDCMPEKIARNTKYIICGDVEHYIAS